MSEFVPHEQIRQAVRAYKTGIASAGLELGEPIPQDHPNRRIVVNYYCQFLDTVKVFMGVYDGTEKDPVEELLERCRCAAELVEAVHYAPDPSQRDFQSAVTDVWDRAWSHFKVQNPPPSLPGVTSKIQALEALGRLTEWLEGQRAQHAGTNRIGAADRGGVGHAEGDKSNRAGAGQAEGRGKKKGKGGKRPLEQSNLVKFQVYERIQREHHPDEEYVDTVERLRADKDFAEQVRAVRLKLNTDLVRNALAFFDHRRRAQARNKQETDPT
jgi:hypothetical protein